MTDEMLAATSRSGSRSSREHATSSLRRADGARRSTTSTTLAAPPRSKPPPRSAAAIDDARRGQRHARHRQLAARVPRRAGASTPTSTGTRVTRVPHGRVRRPAADALRELPALHAREGRGDHPGEGVPLPRRRHRRRAGRSRPLRGAAPRASTRPLLSAGSARTATSRSTIRRLPTSTTRADVKIVALEPASRRQQVAEGHFATIDDVPTHAITVTIPALVRARSACSRSCPRPARRFRCATRSTADRHGLPGVVPPPPAARHAVPRRRLGVTARPVTEAQGQAQPHEEARYAQVLRFPNRRELARRFPPLVAGLLVIGFSISISVRAELGVAPWDVLHQGIAKATGTVDRRRGRARRPRGAARVDPVAPTPRYRDDPEHAVDRLHREPRPRVDPRAARARGPRSGSSLVAILGFGLGGGLYIGCGLGPGPATGS